MRTEKDCDRGSEMQELIYNNLCCQRQTVFQRGHTFAQARNMQTITTHVDTCVSMHAHAFHISAHMLLLSAFTTILYFTTTRERCGVVLCGGPQTAHQHVSETFEKQHRNLWVYARCLKETPKHN